MIARATLALMLAGPILASAMTVGIGTASAQTPLRKTMPHAGPGGRERASMSGQRRTRNPTQVAAKSGRHDAPPALVATLDDGLAYDTPRDALGHPILTTPIEDSSAGQPTGPAWQIGTASWYGGSRWQGRRMSDGNVYQQDELTAAHVSLPLGSLVRVSLLRDTRSVVVRITDRPGTRRRIIDLSRAAAAKLGILASGIAQVRLDPL